MNILTLVRNIRDAIYDDVATLSWCQAEYGRRHQVFCGVDTRKLQTQADYPLVHVFPVRRISGNRFEEQRNVIGISVGLVNTDTSAEEAAVAGRPSLIEMQGISHLETFRQLVETAAAGADLLNGWIDSLEVEYGDPLECFPFFVAEMLAEVNIPYSQGDDPFA